MAWDANREEWVCGCGHSAGRQLCYEIRNGALVCTSAERAVKVGPIGTQECGSAGPHEGPVGCAR